MRNFIVTLSWVLESRIAQHNVRAWFRGFVNYSHIVGDHNGDVVVSFRNGISVHFCTHYAYPTVPAGVHVTHISGVGFSDEDLSLLASQINTAAYSTLVDAAAHIENACK